MLTFEKTLHIEEREKVIQERIDRYFEHQGYQIRHNSDGVYYERGTAWRNYIAMSPAGWHVFAAVSLETAGTATLVDTQGQIVLDRERNYWETEFDVLVDYLETGKNKREDIVGQLGRYNLRHNIYLTVALVLLFILGFMLVGSYIMSSCAC